MWSIVDQVVLLGDQNFICLSLEDNTLCQATFGEVGKDLWSSSVSDDDVHIEKLSQVSSEEKSRFQWSVKVKDNVAMN